MEFILNEFSLNGQYSSMDEFVSELGNVVGCINAIRKNQNNAIFKTYNFYKSKITQRERICDLKRIISTDDELKAFQLTLDREVYDQPFWDEEHGQDIESSYWWGNENVSLTGMAEAAATSKQLLSFRMSGLMDEEIEIKEKTSKGKENIFYVDSIFSVKYLIKKYGSQLGMTRDEVLIERYRGTRVDYSTIERKYGAETLEESEYKLLIGTLDKFVKCESFEAIALDDGFEYKKYSPSQKKKNWFSNGNYRNKCIMKIRCSDVLRVFGYRKGDKFRVLRIERDHKVSDYG